MSYTHDGIDQSGNGHRVSLVQHPDECPRCHRAVTPRYLSTHVHQSTSTLQVCFRCPRYECQEIFIADYIVVAGGTYAHVVSSPIAPKPGVYPDTVRTTSPTAIEIFDQAAAAETHQLKQLVGIGLRKGLEFLVKDYLVTLHADKAKSEEIKKKMLGNCINDYVTDPNIKACAARAAWLGNDETHYVRKWEDKDITDLKQLIRLTMNWIDSAIMTEKYLKDMNTPKK